MERLAAAHDAGRLQFFGYGKRWQAEAVMALAGLGIMPPSDPCRHAGGRHAREGRPGRVRGVAAGVAGGK